MSDPSGDPRSMADGDAVVPSAASHLEQVPAEDAQHEDDVGEPHVKHWQQFEIEFREPAVVEAGKKLPLSLIVQGAPGAKVDVQLFGGAGVRVQDAVTRAVELDSSGRAELATFVEVPSPTGCSVVAQVASGDGRIQEAHCTLGGPAPRVPPDVRETSSGDRVRISPAPEAEGDQEDELPDLGEDLDGSELDDEQR